MGVHESKTLSFVYPLVGVVVFLSRSDQSGFNYMGVHESKTLSFVYPLVGVVVFFPEVISQASIIWESMSPRRCLSFIHW